MIQPDPKTLTVIGLILRDICELPGDDDPDDPDTLVLSWSVLEAILKRHLLGEE